MIPPPHSLCKLGGLAILLAIGTSSCDTTMQEYEENCTEYISALVDYETIVPEGYTQPLALGGYGSGMCYDTTDSTFYLLTDRGPNTDGETTESKVFQMPSYAPTVGCFKLKENRLQLIKKIELKDAHGVPFTGLPNTEGDGVTGEVAYDLEGNIVKQPNRGIDSEGLALAPDKSLWVSDEYAPFIIHFSPEGVLLREFSPGNGLPTYFAKRRPNRGMEGLTLSKKGSTLYGIMQSPLYLPDSRTKNQSVNNRIVKMEVATGELSEYLYQLDRPKNLVSEICWVTDSTLLVIERDGKFPSAATPAVKLVYKINLSHATSIAHREVENLSNEELSAQGIVPVTKELVVDLVDAIAGYSHDKPEGVALFDANTICVVNDDDFAVSETKDGGYAPKIDGYGDVDHSRVYWIKLKKSLY